MNWNDPVFQQQFDIMSATQDMTERTALIKTLNQYVVSQIPYIQIPTAYATTFWWPWVKNYWGEGNVGYAMRNENWRTMWVDQELKKEMGHD